MLSQHDFIEGWTRRYGDNHKDTTTFFHSLDSDANGVLTADDLQLHWPLLDADGKAKKKSLLIYNIVQKWKSNIL